MREKIKEILEEVRPDIDFETETQLIDGHILESFDVVNIISSLEDEYDIKIKPRFVTPDNFNSVDALVELVSKIKG